MPIERMNRVGRPGQRRQVGFTLVELMVTVAVIAILAIIAMPAMSALINNSRATGQAEELVASLQLARAEAVRRNARVTICGGTNGVCSGSASWNQLTVFGRDLISGSADPEVIRDTSASGNVQVTGPTAGIVFKPSGRIDATQQLGVAMSDQKRCITVLISGVVSVSKSACS